MIIILKIIHFLALAVGVGGGVASAVVRSRIRKADPAARPALVAVMAGIGRLGLYAIILLWITGVGLTYLYYDGWENLPASFWLKITFVVILTGLSVRLNLPSAAQLPDNIKALLAQMAAICSVLVVIFATLAFTH